MKLAGTDSEYNQIKKWDRRFPFLRNKFNYEYFVYVFRHIDISAAYVLKEMMWEQDWGLLKQKTTVLAVVFILQIIF